MAHYCTNLIVTCLDYRLQEKLENWSRQKYGATGYDRIAWEGACFSLDLIMTQVKISMELHHISRVVLVNHQDCDAYGPTGTRQDHERDLAAAKERIHTAYPDLKVDLYYLLLNGTFEEVLD